MVCGCLLFVVCCVLFLLVCVTFLFGHFSGEAITQELSQLKMVTILVPGIGLGLVSHCSRSDHEPVAKQAPRPFRMVACVFLWEACLLGAELRVVCCVCCVCVVLCVWVVLFSVLGLKRKRTHKKHKEKSMAKGKGKQGAARPACFCLFCSSSGFALPWRPLRVFANGVNRTAESVLLSAKPKNNNPTHHGFLFCSNPAIRTKSRANHTMLF